MSHSPPVPQGNQSPYPIVEPPHEKAGDNLPPAAQAQSRRLPIGKLGAAMGLGATLIAGVLLSLRRGKPAKRKKG